MHYKDRMRDLNAYRRSMPRKTDAIPTALEPRPNCRLDAAPMNGMRDDVGAIGDVDAAGVVVVVRECGTLTVSISAVPVAVATGVTVRSHGTVRVTVGVADGHPGQGTTVVVKPGTRVSGLMGVDPVQTLVTVYVASARPVGQSVE